MYRWSGDMSTAGVLPASISFSMPMMMHNLSTRTCTTGSVMFNPASWSGCSLMSMRVTLTATLAGFACGFDQQLISFHSFNLGGIPYGHGGQDPLRHWEQRHWFQTPPLRV